jgi:hypothetical protein
MSAGGRRAAECSGVRDACRIDVHASTPWVAQAPPSREIAALVMPGAQHLIEYHVLVSGTCWASLLDDGAEPIALAPGSVLVFPHGDQHVLSSAPHMRGQPRYDVYSPASSENPLPFYLDSGEGGPKGAQIICGFLGCDARPFNPLIAALPACSTLRTAPLPRRAGWGP